MLPPSLLERKVLKGAELQREELRTIELLPWEIGFKAVYSPDNRWLAVGTSRGVHLYDQESLEEAWFLSTDAWVRGLAFSPDGTQLAVGGYARTIDLVEVSTGSVIMSFEGHEDWIRDLDFSPDGQFLASGADDHTVRIWDVSRGEQVGMIDQGVEGINCLSYSPEGSFLATGTRDGLVKIWNLSDGSLERELAGHTDWVRIVAFSPDGKTLVSGAFDATAKIWRVEDGALVTDLTEHTASVLGAAFSSDSHFLATGSVDSTVKLWRAADGTLLNTLQGNTSFTYDVAISPSGEYLTAVGEDHLVREWKITNREYLAEYNPEPVSSDCRTCHHPPTNTKPPRVVSVRCEICHQAGASFNWCPIFVQATEHPAGKLGTQLAVDNSGVPLGGERVAVTLAYPSNGEVVYTSGKYIAPLEVKGYVQTEGIEPTSVSTVLEIWKGTSKVKTLHTTPDQSGVFTFALALNPDGTDPVEGGSQLRASGIICSECHSDYQAEAYVPAGDIQFKVIAETPQGDQAADSRWLSVDISEKIDLTVLVRDKDSGNPLSGIAVEATTRLYEWRARDIDKQTDEKGIAVLPLESLTQSSMVYRIRVPEQVVDGVYFSGIKSQELIIKPDEAPQPTIELLVNATKGKIDGRLLSENNILGSIPIWAFQLPAGPVFQTTITQAGKFTLADLPVSRYLVFPDPTRLKDLGLRFTSQTIDLTQSPESAVEFKIQQVAGTILEGEVFAEKSDWIPFTWVSYQEETASVDLSSGKWVVSGLETGDQIISVHSPGYYSQTVKVDREELRDGSLIIRMERQPGTRTLDWSGGTVVLPAGTEAVIEGSKILLNNGWLWGFGIKEKPVRIQLANTSIQVEKGRFAVEALYGQPDWFYLFDGLAAAVNMETNQTTRIYNGDMLVIIEDDMNRVTIDPALINAVIRDDRIPVDPVWKPGLLSSIKQITTNTSISLVQFVTFITYLLVILSVLVIPFFGIKIWINKKDNYGDDL